MAEENRSQLFAILAVPFALLAVSNLLKPFQLFGEETGFVLFGHRLSGTANMVAGPLFGLYLLAYSYGIWNQKRFALPMSHAYALYVVLNLLLYMANNTRPPGVRYLFFSIVYSVIAIGVSVSAAVFLTSRKAELS